MKTRGPLNERFWRMVKKTEGCWLWQGAKTHGGYGVVQRGGRVEGLARAHRLAFEWAKGPIPPGAVLCHRCDTPACVRPAHLFVGTQTDNMRDAKAKGRTRGGGPIHEAHHAAKLTMDGARAIRAGRAAGVSLNELARTFGVSKKTILNIAQGKVWRELQ